MTISQENEELGMRKKFYHRGLLTKGQLRVLGVIRFSLQPTSFDRMNSRMYRTGCEIARCSLCLCASVRGFLK